ncbi:hypothetical protein WCT87_07035 [Pectobacterium brasiliense]|uniref:hypothetical protein n=1 Tax=Pectobacterium brasiliense TaxID=180957 RepID=UPI0030173865
MATKKIRNGEKLATTVNIENGAYAGCTAIIIYRMVSYILGDDSFPGVLAYVYKNDFDPECDSDIGFFRLPCRTESQSDQEWIFQVEKYLKYHAEQESTETQKRIDAEKNNPTPYDFDYD